MKILVRRTGALGDVVLTTPIVRHLKRENPDAEIWVQTAYPDVFRNNPHVYLTCGPSGEPHPSAILKQIHYIFPRNFDHFIDLDMTYERQPKMHIVEAYMLHAFGDAGRIEDKQQELFFDRTPMKHIAGKGYVAVHAAVAGWKNRTLPRDTWREVLHRLNVAGLQPILIGTDRDDVPNFECQRFFTPDIHMQATLIQSCECFVGSDSGLLHVAGTTDTPIVGVFTCADPEYRLPFREKCVAVTPDLNCIGCLGRRGAPVTTESCERGDIACVAMVRATDIVDATLKLIV